MAPSDKERVAFATTSAGSNARFVPRPLHSGQAPAGLLKENIWGVNSGILRPHFGHAASWLKKNIAGTHHFHHSPPIAEGQCQFHGIG